MVYFIKAYKFQSSIQASRNSLEYIMSGLFVFPSFFF